MRYAYNAIGNLRERNTTDASDNSNPAGEFYEKWFGTAQYGPSRPHAFTGADGGDGPGGRDIQAQYDAVGNMKELTVVNPTTDGTTVFVFTWDHYNRLVAVTKSANNATIVQAEYRYDYGNERTFKAQEKDQQVSTVTYVADELEIRDRETVCYIFGHRRLARLDSQGRKFMHSGHLGSTTAVTLDDGTVVETVSNLPFGNIEARTGSFQEPYQFTGKEREADLGIIYFSARYYNPAIGRWLSVDPLALFQNQTGGFSSYVYASNSPLEFVDPDGLQGFRGLSKYTRTKQARARFYDRNAKARKKWYSSREKGAKGVAKLANICGWVGWYGGRAALAVATRGASESVIHEVEKAYRRSKKTKEIKKSVRSIPQRLREVGRKVRDRSRSGRQLTREEKTNLAKLAAAAALAAAALKRYVSRRKAPRETGPKDLNKLLKGAKPGRTTKGRTRQFTKPGGMEQATKDFQSLGPKNVKDIPGGGRVGTLPAGRRVVVRPKSSSGSPTVEIQKGKSRTKIRYKD